MTALLITGSRQATPTMLEFVDQLVLDAKADGDSNIVGDAEGVDARVIEQCDLLRVPVTVYGGYKRLRRMAQTGMNFGLDATYPERDRHMAMICDECVAVWNGTSRGTKLTFDSARSYHKPTTIYLCVGENVRKIPMGGVDHE